MKKLFTGQVTITFVLTADDIDDIIACALEGGINYWCSEAKVIGEYLGEYASEQISRGGILELYDAEDDEAYMLDAKKFMYGFETWIENGYDYNGAVGANGKVDTSLIDAGDADTIIQLALFDEVVYG
jgi:hypothetical protein